MDNSVDGGRMTQLAEVDGVYGISDEVVARDIEGELIIVPITAGAADLEDVLYSLNETGRAVWDRLDGVTPLSGVCRALSEEYDGEPEGITGDVLGLVSALLERGIVVRLDHA